MASQAPPDRGGAVRGPAARIHGKQALLAVESLQSMAFFFLHQVSCVYFYTAVPVPPLSCVPVPSLSCVLVPSFSCILVLVPPVYLYPLLIKVQLCIPSIQALAPLDWDHLQLRVVQPVHVNGQ